MQIPLSAMANVRPAAVAGAFYPGDPGELLAEIDELLGTAGSFTPRFAHPKALIVPHAGYVYSGGVAASAYGELAGARGVVRRVVLLGPVHRVPVRGLALPAAEGFATPLGTVPIDRGAAKLASALPQVVTSAAAHAMEHSLEVQLPFLQRVLGEFSLVPFAVGDASAEEVAQVLECLWGGAETLIVVSTDLSHYHAYDEARRIDADTLERIAHLSGDLDHDQACGATPLNGLLRVARAKGLKIRRLAACNSGDSAGGRGRVVGYASLALDEGVSVTESEAGGTLVGIAHGAIATDLGLDATPRDVAAAWLKQPGATFVTLTKGGALRGCIGSLAAERPLGADVAANAINAAFRDPRFPPVTAAEWPQVQVEVSLLSTPRTLCFADEAELLDAIVPGEDGLILEADGRRGTFLPQVWENLPDKRQFLAELKLKAGLPAETRITRCRVSRYRVLKFGQTALH
jgi:hypothetical protein